MTDPNSSICWRESVIGKVSINGKDSMTIEGHLDFEGEVIHKHLSALGPCDRVAVRLQAVQSYLEIEFPGQVDGMIENTIVVSHDGIRHYVVLQPTFLNLCPNYMQAIRGSELVESMREFRSQARRFLIAWNKQEARIRWTSLRHSGTKT